MFSLLAVANLWLVYMGLILILAPYPTVHWSTWVGFFFLVLWHCQWLKSLRTKSFLQEISSFCIAADGTVLGATRSCKAGLCLTGLRQRSLLLIRKQVQMLFINGHVLLLFWLIQSPYSTVACSWVPFLVYTLPFFQNVDWAWDGGQHTGKQRNGWKWGNSQLKDQSQGN